MKELFDIYLGRLEIAGHSPNFWCASEFVEKAGWAVVNNHGTLSVISDGKKMLPSIDRVGVYERPYWAGFSTNYEGMFLDYEFIYNPDDFFHLEGSQWRILRKNLRWALQDVQEDLVIDFCFADKDIDMFLSCWHAAQQEEFYDPEVFLKYLYFGDNRIFMRGANTGKLRAILAWDENWKYVNFRYCAVLPGTRGLSDLCRHMFYRYMATHRPGKLVNDGGALDREGLLVYKSRLNPVSINKIGGFYGTE